MQPGPSSRLQELGYELPEVPQPAGSYVSAIRAGDLIFTAGQLPFQGRFLTPHRQSRR